MLASVALVFSGGVGLGAYQAGAYTCLREDERFEPRLFAGSSIGAVNGAIIVGSRPEKRVENLRSYWSATNSLVPISRLPQSGHWLSAIQARVFGVQGHFRPRITHPWRHFSSLYDLSPMRERLERLVDFDRLNGGEEAFCVAATDLNSGVATLFDTRLHRIEMDHLLASCGFIPEFAPVAIGGGLFGDGGLSANAPLEAVLFEPVEKIFVVDLFARDGTYSPDLQTAVARKNDLIYGNQTLRTLELVMRERSRAQNRNNQTIFYLSYHPALAEAGPERTFDFSADAFRLRWQVGASDMNSAVALARSATPGLHVIGARSAIAQDSGYSR